ncbi:hypothetical protein TNCV_27561 [Trichonephila clavipes]|uniref:Uncharacterized protein n=1 Tax=Trichonephila clavipes TaxID=2585209 RepID=A0A8X6WMQ6_TRICX|nr:hypothetical protein TNCV_27561 [Trichonephila clavipes]
MNTKLAWELNTGGFGQTDYLTETSAHTPYRLHPTKTEIGREFISLNSDELLSPHKIEVKIERQKGSLAAFQFPCQTSQAAPSSGMTLKGLRGVGEHGYSFMRFRLGTIKGWNRRENRNLDLWEILISLIVYFASG